mgnify:CR=1 FL=1
MTGPALTLDGLTKSFGDLTAVSDLHATVEQGEVFGLLGNGNAHLVDAMLRLTPIRYTAVRHEAATVASADAHSHDDIRALIDFAAALGVRITPSLDMPGHLDHALDAHPDLRLRDAAGGEVFGALDVSNPTAVDFALDLGAVDIGVDVDIIRHRHRLGGVENGHRIIIGHTIRQGRGRGGQGGADAHEGLLADHVTAVDRFLDRAGGMAGGNVSNAKRS